MLVWNKDCTLDMQDRLGESNTSARNASLLSTYCCSSDFKNVRALMSTIIDPTIVYTHYCVCGWDYVVHHSG